MSDRGDDWDGASCDRADHSLVAEREKVLEAPSSAREHDHVNAGLARGGGSFEDLLPFSDERVVRAIAGCSAPVVSAVGHEQDTPLCDHAADVRASTPTAAARLVVPDERELRERLDTARAALARGAATTVERAGSSLVRDWERLSRAPALLVERKRAGLEGLAGRLQALSPQKTLARGYAIVRTDNGIVRSSAELSVGKRVEVELAEGGFGGRVEETRP